MRAPALFIFVVSFHLASSAAGSVLHPVDLRCEFLKTPLGIDRPHPRLSWKLDALGSARRGLMQTAYQIQVAASETELASGKPSLWDSGKVDSDQNNLVTYAGKPLESRQLCWWRVRIWDKSGYGSVWSKPAMWSMGLLHPSDWDAKWIGINGGDQTIPGDPHTRLPARMLRREFDASKPIRRATVYACGLGFFDLYLNGARVGDHVMDPALTDYSKLILYLTFDVTHQIQTGKNAIGEVLGNGRFFAPRAGGKTPAKFTNYGYPRLLFQLEIEYADGTTERVASDKNWKATADGPIRANNEYDGEEYDARKEMLGWDKPGFNDAGWQNADLMDSPGGELHAQMVEPTKDTEVIKPISIHQTRSGSYIVDFGQSFYGQIHLRASAPAGTVVKMREAYSLNPDGSLRTADNRSARATDIYTFKGVGVETWSPRFRGQGFRRVEVIGLPGRVTIDEFEALVVENALDSVGTFECSIPLVNQIYRNVRWGQRIFLRNGVPLDPDRDERQPWVGDPAKDSEGEAFNFNVAAYYQKWIHDNFLDQHADGQLGDVAPEYWSFFHPDDIAWPSVVTIIPDWMYSFYGDRDILEADYGPMKKWVEYVARQLKPDYTVDNCTYGDWCDTASMDGKGKDHGATSLPLIGTAYCYLNAKLMARTAERLGNSEDERHYEDLAAKIRDGFNKRFLNSQTARYESATQTSYVLPLAFGMVPDDVRPRVIQNLVDDIMVQHDGYSTVGLIGMQWLMEVLTETGHTEVALSIATRTKRPSWGYMIAQGATTIWERYDMNTRDPGMNSEALLIQTGDVVTWFYEALAGINYDPAHPGFKNVVLHPRVVPGLTFARATLDSPQGKIVSDWQTRGGEFHWHIVVPPNATATVYMPTKVPDTVREGGKPAASADGVRFVRSEDNEAVYEVGSGSYEFTCPHPSR
jgi:alpha-L-rhamnosidase